MSAARLKEMFRETVIAKDIDKVPVYYHPELTLRSGGEIQRFGEFFADHQKYFGSATSYRVDLDEETLVECDGRVAARFWLTMSSPGAEPERLELLWIAL